MTTILLGLLTSTACGPAVSEIDRELLGHLEWEPLHVDYYRNGDRIEFYTDGSSFGVESTSRCGYLRPDAYESLLATIAALDPGSQYPPPGETCENDFGDTVRADWGTLDLENFAQTPFDCITSCCSPELQPMIDFYFSASMELLGGSPYPDSDLYDRQIDFDRPCEPVLQDE